MRKHPDLPNADLEDAPKLQDFQITSRVGEGAMGAVYKAWQKSFGRDVALKVLFKHISSNPKLVERLHREGLAMGQLDHPNVVRGFGVDEYDGWHYVIMEYVDGDSLQRWLGRLGALSVGDSLHIAIACAKGLQHAHDLGLVHRDVKPDNVLISRSGEVKLADLGMVKTIDDEMSITQTGHAVGTPWYMPLEQARNAKDIDCRSDIYALGCMLHCMLTGVPPFSAPTLIEVIEKKEVGTFKPSRLSNPDVPERLDLIIAKMTAKNPKHRYQNCQELLKDLNGVGLASPRLSFLTSTPALPRNKQPEAELPGRSTSAGVQAPEAELPANTWYIRFPAADGQLIVRKVTTEQVIGLLEAGKLDLSTAKLSRRKHEGYGALATYREFRHLVARVSKEAADEKTVRYRNLYKKIEEEDLAREKQKSEEITTFGYWLPIFVRVAAACAGVGILIAFVIALARAFQ